MDKISPYYSFYIKGVAGAKSNSLVKIRLAAEDLKKSLSYKKTQEAYNTLLICYMKLDENDLYEKTLLDAVGDGFTYFYASCGMYYANHEDNYNKEKSLLWFSKGMEACEPKAFSDLANLYITGCKAFRSDYIKAEEVLLKGLKLNDSKWNGYFNWALGLIEYEKKSFIDAANYYKKAIDEGYAQASFNLALMYRDGVGVEKDPELYIENLLKHLSVQSALEIAGIYMLGQYAPKDIEIAFIYLDYAAKNGNPVGAIMCAAMIIKKEDYSEDLLNKYLEIAFMNGANDENMKENYDMIEDTLGEKARNKIQELASKYWEIRKNKA